MENKFTPGPWSILPDPKGLSSAPVVMSSTRNVAKVLYHLGSEDREVVPNAFLIATAPELLEALKMMKEVTKTLGKGIGHLAVDADFFGLWNDAEVAASKAIMKATKGES